MSTRTLRVHGYPVVPTIDGLWVLVAVVVPTAGAFASRMMAIDLAYQIRAGQVMLDTRRLLDVDIFTFTIHGQPWLNQQWGAEVLLALFFRMGGWTAVAVMRGVLLGSVLVLLYKACRAAGSAPRTAALLTIAGWSVGIEILPSMRPQSFGFLLFASVTWILIASRSAPNRLWLVPPIVLLWANLHGSFPLAFVLLGLAWLQHHRQDAELGRRLLLVAGVSVLASLANPFGPRVWPYALNLLTDPEVVRQVAEWGPPSVHTVTGLFFFASLLAIAALFARRPRLVTSGHLFTLGIFGCLGLIAIRGVGWWALTAPIVVASLLGDAESPRDDGRPPFHGALAASLVCLALLTLPIGRGQDAITGGPAVLTYAPQDLVASAVRAAPSNHRAFVSQLFASWVEFSAPSLLVAVDPRIEIFPTDVWEDYFVVSEGREGWDEVLDRWNARLLILERSQAAGLLEVLPSHPEWRSIVEDGSGAVYARTSAVT